MNPNELGLKKGIVKLAPHNQNWKNVFEEEKQMLLSNFPGIISEVIHTGSTSIPGIPAKPIVDISAVVPSLAIGETLKSSLENLGYTYLGDAGVPGRVFFSKHRGEEVTHHLNLVEQNSENWNNHLLFKNYCLKYPEVAQEYARLKESLAEKYPNDRDAYWEGKNNFIQSVIKRAKEDY